MAVCKKTEAFAKRIRKMDLPTITEEKARQLFEEILPLIVEFWNLSVFIDFFDAGIDYKEIEKINSRYGFSKQEIQVLTTPAKKTYAQENRLLLFDLAENYSIEKANAFLEKFFWIKTDYVSAERFEKKELEEELETIKKTNWKKEKKELSESFSELEKKQKEILEAKNLKENPFWLYYELTFWRDERKRYNYMSLFALTQIALEILKRKGLQKYLPFITIKELFSLPSEAELKRRKKCSLFIITSDFFVYSEDDAEKRFWKIVGVKEFNGDLRGMSASMGTATGKARIILSPKEFNKMQQGDVLITHNTRPEFVPIMKRAAAIVTDEGGITSHAAIISRELGIPCVVGTQIATKVFKDNDLVEVRANHGLVRKVSL
jgi:phosphohistidine swiveling domain-containing protein